MMMLGWWRKRRAYRLGRETGAQITAYVDEYMATRQKTISAGYLRILKERMAAPYDKPISRRDHIGVEFQVYLDQVLELRERLSGEVRHYVDMEWGDVLAEIEGQADLVQQYIGMKARAFEEEMMAAGFRALSEASEAAKTDYSEFVWSKRP